MFHSKEIADLKAKLEAAEGEMAGLKAEKDTFTTQLAAEAAKVTAAQGELAGVKAELETANGTIATHVATIAAKDAEIKAGADKFEKDVADEVVNRAAAAGMAPIAKDPTAGAKEGDTKEKPGTGLKGQAKTRALLQARIDAQNGK